MKKYFCLIIACISLLTASAQNHTDTLQFLYKKKAFKQGLDYCQKHNIAENGYGKDLYYAGLIYHEANRICESYRLLEKAMNSFTLNKKEGKKAIKIIQENKVMYDSTTYFYSKAYDAHQDKKFEEAQHYLDKVLQNDAHFIDALQFRLILAVEFENEKEIEQYFALIKSENPYFTKCYKTVGTYYVDKEKFEKALLVYNDLVKLDEASGYFSLGSVYYDMDEYEKAMTAYRKSYAIDKDKAAFFNIGLCYKNLLKYDMAIQVFLNLKNANYDKGIIDEEIAHCYYSLNNFVKASEYFRAAIKAQPNEARNYYNVGLSIYYDTSEKINSDSVYNEAFLYFKRACELNPADPKYHYFKGYALLYTDRDREAMQYVKKAISIDSTDYDYWDTYNRLCIGDCSNKEKRKIAREGINCFKALIKKDTSNASFYYALGRNYEWYKEDLSGNSYSKYVDSARICFKIAWALDTSKGIYLEEYLGYLDIKDEWVKKMVNDFLKRHPENTEVSRILFWDAYWEKDYKTANALYFNMNTFAPQDWATKQINDAVKELKNKYSWSDICERKPCYYMYEH